MDGRPTWTDCDEAGDYVVPNVLSPRDLVFRPDNMDETVPHTTFNTHIPSPVYSIRCLLLLTFRSLAAIVTEKSTIFTFSYRKA